MKNNYKFIIKLGLILFLIVFVSTFVLSMVNSITEDIIIQKNIELENNARKNVMNDADTFEKIDGYKPLNESINNVYISYKNNERVGYCINVSPKGYGGKINMIVGVNENLNVTGVTITSMSETAGLGANAVKPDFLNQFNGKTSDIRVVKNSSNEINTINAISGATITSKAVTDGVNTAIKEAKNIKEVVK